MLGRTHSVHGACAGLALGAAWGTPPAWTLAMGGVGWVGALLPDLDTSSSTASRALGPVTGLVSWCVRGASRLAYAATKGPADEDHSGVHRHLAHSLVAAVAVGLVVWLLLRPWTPMAPQLAASVTAGMVAALCGDACTVNGVSGFLYPIKIRGERFYECYLLPPGLRIRTGRLAERVILAVSLVGLVLLVPGVWSLVAPVAGGLWLAVVG
jgi:membrane-bound metal-dependent hydrolase YbcI (DUF457 family)